MSQSGWAAPQNHAAQIGLHLRPTVESGGHRLSAIAVTEGRADIAALDALTWELLCRYDGFATSLKEIARTAPPTPALPFITAKGADADLYFRVVSQAIAALSPEDKVVLHLKGLVRIPVETYLAVPTPPTPEQIAQAI